MNAQDQKPTILFLDDEGAILSSLRSLFRKEGYGLQLYESGDEAMHYLHDHRVDLIVSDMRMPEMSGREFLEGAATLCPDAVRVMMSGYEDKQIILDALAGGLAHFYTIKPWDDGALKELIRVALARQDEIRTMRLKEILGSFVALPSLPNLHGRLLEVLGHEDVPMGEIVAEIEKSPPLVVKLLKVANSVYFGARQAITSIGDALRLIGVQYLGSIAVGLDAFEAASHSSNGQTQRILQNMWQDAVRRATIAKAIGKQKPGFTDHQLLYVSALLLDIGYVVRLSTQRERYMEMLALSADENIPLYEADKRVFIFTHDVIGGALLDYWNLPHPIANAVAKHHGLAEDDPLVQLTQMADILMDPASVEPHDPALAGPVVEWQKRMNTE
jgi:HD-like signal output (HDOD) protein/CheY-like chemotaxis protein